jgi:hypothetical protein
LTISNYDAVRGPNGATLIEASDSTVLELGIAYTFP